MSWGTMYLLFIQRGHLVSDEPPHQQTPTITEPELCGTMVTRCFARGSPAHDGIVNNKWKVVMLS